MDLVAMKFDRDVAREIGTDSAIVLQNLEFWILKNKANNKNFHDGLFWTYMSVKGFGELFDWLSERQIRTCLKKLVDNNYLTEGNYNKSTYDRTKWYTSNRLNEKLHLTESSNRKDQSVKPIPYNNTDKNTNKNNIGDKSPSKSKRFVPPTIEEIKLYCKEVSIEIDAEYFIDYNESKGWMIGKHKMKNWKSALRNWNRNQKKWNTSNQQEPDKKLKML
tara:strand:+ start:33 stop:689 length:657 start_codon:yes stop_codon:yes gene_type:complete